MSSGAEVDKYILGKTIGNGTTGKVKLAQHRETRAQVAVKIIKKSQFDKNPDLQPKIRREMALMRLLNHPHLLKLIEVCESPRHLYLILEYASGGDLFEFLVARRRLEPQLAIELFRQMIYGLDYLHSHGICHRDLKPENLLLDSKNSIKIADFGFARWMKTNVIDTTCGSPHYTAPEVIRGLPYDGRRADAWSAGVILYAMLVGRLPFDDPSIRTLLAKIKMGNYEIPGHVPAIIKDLIEKLLKVDPNERLTIEQVKEHSAFHIFLPEDYKVPTPLPLGAMTKPIKMEDVDSSLMVILKSIGYESDEEIAEELSAGSPTMAKVFYMMFMRISDVEDLPWPGRDSDACVDDMEAQFIMPASQIAMGVAQNPFRRREVIEPGSLGYVVGSVAAPATWGNDPLPEVEVTDEQMFEGIPLSIADIFAKAQQMFDRQGYDWFHPNDQEMLVRVPTSEGFMYLKVIASSDDVNSTSIVMKVVHGGKGREFGDIIANFKDLMEVAVDDQDGLMMSI